MKANQRSPAASWPESPSFTSNATEAFDRLVRSHYGRLCAFAFRMTRSHEAAEDVVHDVLLRIWRERERFDFNDPLAYLYRSIRNRVISANRHKVIQSTVLVRLAGERVASTPDAALEAERDELSLAVARAVDSLPERCRLIFTMNREQGLSYPEIARVLDLSPKTVENQMSRAFKLLRTRLSNCLSLAIMVASLLSDVWKRTGS